MCQRANVSPVPLHVVTEDDAVIVEYLDGRTVHYRGPIETAAGRIESTTTVENHVLIVDSTDPEGIMVYINDYDTIDEILEATGVGRLMLADGDQEVIYPGIAAERVGERITVTASDDLDDEAVYVFVEHQLNERAYRLEPPAGR